MPKQRPHLYDEAADELLGWLEDSVDDYADALRGGQRAPFSADVSEDQKLDYYRRQVFKTNPDGTANFEQPNETGREMLLNRVGIRGYTDIMAAIMGNRGKTSYQTLDMEEEEEDDDDVSPDASTGTPDYAPGTGTY